MQAAATAQSSTEQGELIFLMLETDIFLEKFLLVENNEMLVLL